ncbi:MAG: phosphatase PAP2 family protein [bacterium]
MFITKKGYRVEGIGYRKNYFKKFFLLLLFTLPSPPSRTGPPPGNRSYPEHCEGISLIPCVYADENRFLSPDYVKRVGSDLKELPSKPVRWSGKQWLLAGGVLAATAGAFSVDGDIRQHFRSHRNNFLGGMSEAVTHFGDYKYQLPLLSAFWIAGATTGNGLMSKIASDGAEASLLAAGMITPAIVYISGRALPSAGERAMLFRGFTPGRYSFPSGHTTEAFAMAAVLDVNLRKHFGYWHSPVVYSIAAAVAESRIYDHKHYLSDVILGAGIGWSVGWWIASKPRNGPKLALMPLPGGLAAVWRF